MQLYFIWLISCWTIWGNCISQTNLSMISLILSTYTSIFIIGIIFLGIANHKISCICVSTRTLHDSLVYHGWFKCIGAFQPYSIFCLFSGTHTIDLSTQSNFSILIKFWLFLSFKFLFVNLLLQNLIMNGIQ